MTTSTDFAKSYLSKSSLEQAVSKQKVKGNVFLALGLILLLVGTTLCLIIAKDLIGSTQTAGTVLRYDEEHIVGHEDDAKPYILISHHGNILDTDHMPYGPAGEWKAGEKVEMIVLSDGQVALKQALAPQGTTGAIIAGTGIPLLAIGVRSRYGAKKKSMKLGY